LENVARREIMRVSSQNLENISQRMAREISFGILLLMAKGQHPTQAV
jgi:hypothetical protein